MVKTKSNSNIFGGCWTYKSGPKIFVPAPEMLFLGTSKWALLAKVAQKNGTSGTRTKILRPLLQVQHCTKMMELPLGLSVFHFWVGFEPIFKFAFFPLYFTLCTQKDKEHYFCTFFWPNQKSKIARNQQCPCWCKSFCHATSHHTAAKLLNICTRLNSKMVSFNKHFDNHWIIDWTLHKTIYMYFCHATSHHYNRIKYLDTYLNWTNLIS